MESQQDIVDLTINDDDDCLFPTELSETANSLKMDGMVQNKETAKQNHEDETLSVYGPEDSEITAKQNHEDDTLSVYGSEDGEIGTDGRRGERRRKQENNFQENLVKFWKKAKKSNIPIRCI